MRGMSSMRGMNAKHSTPHDHRALKTGAHELQQAAGKVLKHACAAEDPETLGIALAHIEEALDRLSVGMLQAANAVTAGAHHPGPDAGALCFHLRRTAERLHEPVLACQSSRYWARRMIPLGGSEGDDRAGRRPVEDAHAEPAMNG
jgi:hypothetical protein